MALPIWAARLVPSNVTTEHYPLPENIFGSVDPALPEGIGKIAMLSALLENKVAAIASSLENKQQSHYFKATFQSNKEVCRERLPLFEREPNRSDDVAAIRSFISRVSGAMAERNDVLHRVWPVADGRTWSGPRYHSKSVPARRKARRKTDQNWAGWKDYDADTFRRIISKMIALVEESQTIVGRATSLPRLQESAANTVRSRRPVHLRRR